MPVKLIAHRCNDPAVFQRADVDAVEFDVRDSGGRLIVTHDPFTEGVLLSVFLTAANGRFLIVNVKSAGIEPYVIDYLREYAPRSDFFFLDCTVPAMVGLAARHEKRFAVRYSEMEPLDSVLVWAGQAKWVWVDCFTKFVLTAADAELLHSKGFKLCLVSPELQGRVQDIQDHISRCRLEGIEIDAVCTKVWNFEKWSALQNP
jgi:hypothetical protein